MECGKHQYHFAADRVYKETNTFASQDDLLKIYECLEMSIDYVELQAEAGYKINQPGKGAPQGAALNLYVNDFILGDNTYLPILNGKKIVFLTHTHLNYMNTKDIAFAEYTYRHFQNILHKSTLISVVGKKDRRRFFNRIRSNIAQENLQPCFKKLKLLTCLIYGSAVTVFTGAYTT